ncbi:hypothetical protein BZG36_05791, partial [Bifiguratus adelaidae]
LGSNVTKNLVFTDNIQSTVTGVSIAQSDNSFAVAPGTTFPVTVAVNQTLTIPITFSPQSVGSHSATVSLKTTTDPQGVGTNAGVSGTGVSTVPLLQVVPPVISYGGIVVSTGPVNASLTLTNAGGTALTWGNMLKPAAPYT